MIWLLVGFQLLFDFGVFLFLLVLFARLRDLRPTESRETPPPWQEELLSTLDQLLHALADRLPPPALPREVAARGPGHLSLLPGEENLASRLDDKRRRSLSSS
jgi:hypothetical protein